MNTRNNYAPIGYGEAYRRQFEREQAAREAEREAIAEEGAAIRKAREKKLEAERQAKLAEAEAEFDRQVEPEKIKLRRQWLSDHPGKDEKDFEKLSWPHLRANLKDQEREAARSAAEQSLRASGRYSGF